MWTKHKNKNWMKWFSFLFLLQSVFFNEFFIWINLYFDCFFHFFCSCSSHESCGQSIVSRIEKDIWSLEISFFLQFGFKAHFGDRCNFVIITNDPFDVIRSAIAIISIDIVRLNLATNFIWARWIFDRKLYIRNVMAWSQCASDMQYHTIQMVLMHTVALISDAVHTVDAETSHCEWYRSGRFNFIHVAVEAA